jgi:hypothetical protein
MEDIVIKTFALFILALVSISACATAPNPDRFQVKRIGDQMVSMGCFSSQDAMWNETLKTFAPVVKQCPKLIDSIDDITVDGKLYCIAVTFPAYFKCD